MSFPEAVTEMLTHLDGVLELLPSPVGNVSRIPFDVVVLRSLKREKDGIGTVTEENPEANIIVEQGQFLAHIEAHLWSSKNQDVVERSRSFITEIFSLSGAETLNGVFRHLELRDSGGPEFLDGGRLWRIPIGVDLTFEYRFEQAPGTGIIDEVDVTIESDLDETFIVR